MRVLVLGATGAIGRPLTERLVGAGHEVAGTTRRADRAEALRTAGCEPVVVDAFDAPALRGAIARARPEVVVHQLTALDRPLNPRRYGAWLEETNRLRREVTPVIVDAARAAGARRVVAQSVAFLTAPQGPPVLDEDAPAATEEPGAIGEAASAALALEEAVLGAAGIDGVVLRYGFFYGPRTAYAPDGQIADEVRRRRFPVIGDGAGIWSFVHVFDAADATVLALDGPPGVFNVVDDDPAPLGEWLPAFARDVRARRPLRVPAWVARLAAGPHAVHSGTRMRGASNARARRELGWVPAHPTWRRGFAEADAR